MRLQKREGHPQICRKNDTFVFRYSVNRKNWYMGKAPRFLRVSFVFLPVVCGENCSSFDSTYYLSIFFYLPKLKTLPKPYKLVVVSNHNCRVPQEDNTQKEIHASWSLSSTFLFFLLLHLYAEILIATPGKIPLPTFFSLFHLSTAIYGKENDKFFQRGGRDAILTR
eukprot:g74582.t1